jgi:hypothetical protein
MITAIILLQFIKIFMDCQNTPLCFCEYSLDVLFFKITKVSVPEVESISARKSIYIRVHRHILFSGHKPRQSGVSVLFLLTMVTMQDKLITVNSRESVKSCESLYVFTW